MRALRIIGAGGHGRVLADIADSIGYNEIAFFDRKYPELTQSGAWSVLGSPEAFACDAEYVVGVGNNQARMSIIDAMPCPPVALVHPAATVSTYAEIGAGSVVCAGAVVAPFARIGRGCIVNTCSSVDHDCVLDDGVHIAPGANLGGGVSVGALSWIGIGATACEYTTIGTNVMVAAGAVVTSDVADHARVGGVPAKEF